MRILHTSDWHIGKRLMERERLPEQEAALSFLVSVCDEREVDLVLVAGDVFDTYTPSAEAEELFFRTVKALAGERRAVVIVSGNHDDGVRLCASAPLAAEDGVFLFGGASFPMPLKRRGVHAREIGGRHIVIENERGECVYINALPFPNEARLKEEKTEESYPERVQRWIGEGDEAYRGDMPNILLTHLFVAGGAVSDSERSIELGGARAVPADCFSGHAYVALGHLHKRQSMKNAHYCGSLLQYSFDENPDKSVYLLETEGTEVHIAEKIPISCGKKLIRLEANGVAEGISLLHRYGDDVLIELTLHLEEPLTQSDAAALRAASPALIHTVADVQGQEIEPVMLRSRMSDEELFETYYRSAYGGEPAAELKEAFLALLQGEEE